ncbi:HtaA domain-containing protein [Microbacterium aoyamense]|nr:HtaA domain-containing protein [Microbacterium aoyamense]
MPSAIATSEAIVALSCLEWGVKSSLREYVRGLDDGRIEWDAPATEARFPCMRVGREADPDAYVFVADGAVRYFAHGGLMDITLRDITVRVVGDVLTVSVAEQHRAGSIVIAEQDGVERRIADRELVITGDAPRLTSRGVALLGSVYPRGTELDPLRIVIAR